MELYQVVPSPLSCTFPGQPLNRLSTFQLWRADGLMPYLAVEARDFKNILRNYYLHRHYTFEQVLLEVPPPFQSTPDNNNMTNPDIKEE